jgi:hypothetical protein
MLMLEKHKVATNVQNRWQDVDINAKNTGDTALLPSHLDAK